MDASTLKKGYGIVHVCDRQMRETKCMWSAGLKLRWDTLINGWQYMIELEVDGSKSIDELREIALKHFNEIEQNG